MNITVKNEAGNHIDIQPDTVTKVKGNGCEEHCTLYIGAIPIKVEGNAKTLHELIKAEGGKAKLVLPIKNPNTSNVEDEEGKGLPMGDPENIPPPEA